MHKHPSELYKDVSKPSPQQHVDPGNDTLNDPNLFYLVWDWLSGQRHGPSCWQDK